MRALHPDLLARLTSGATTLCTCWRLERRDGVVLGFTDHDRPVELDGLSCAPTSALATAAQEAGLGLAPDTGEVSGALTSEAITDADVAMGRYDGAGVERWLVDWTAPHLNTLVFRGTLGEIVREGAAFRAEVLGLSAALNQPVGRVFQPRCDARFGDARCGIDTGRSDLSGEATVVLLTGDGVVVSGAAAVPAGWLAGGRLEIRGGPRDGCLLRITADAQTVEGRALSLSPATGAAPAKDDLVRLTAGCDGCLETCAGRFGNAANFRGFPFMPGDDWALSAYPEAGGRHDGGEL